MARDHYLAPSSTSEGSKVVRLAAAGAANNYDYREVGKPVKLAGDSRFDLCAAGNEIEGFITSVESSTQNDFSIGGVHEFGRYFALADGLQATPGSAKNKIEKNVVAGNITAKGTALNGYPKVCKATAAGNTLNFKWRVVSLWTAGTGAVGTTIVIERV